MTSTLDRPSFIRQGTSFPSRNPLQLKVARLLSANLEDTSTRLALDTLGKDMLASSSFTPKTLTSKGSLRKEVDGKMAETSRDFLAAFSEVNDQLGVLEDHLRMMGGCCDQIQLELDKANSGTKYLLDHAEGLRKQRSATASQQTIVDLFLNRFTLSDSEISALSSRDMSITEELFHAMDKIERIRDDCTILLAGDEGMGAGMDLMEYTKTHLERGYQKLFKWSSFEVRGYNKDSLEVSGTMRAAISRLKKRVDLLDQVLDVLGNTRSVTVLNMFLDALTRGGPSGLPRPIELHAHDPIRYVGDMLAWIHQTMAGEREFLEGVFNIKDDGRWVGSVRQWATSEQENDDEQRLRKLLDRNMEGCGRPLKIRVHQTIKSQEGSLMAYKIASLIQFYKVTMERTVGNNALMTNILGEIMDDAFTAFFENLRAHGRSLLRFIQPPSAALISPVPLRESLQTLREIIAVFSASLLEDPHAPATQSGVEQDIKSKEKEFAPVLDAVLNPALEMCKTMGEMRSEEWDRAIFGINCDEAVINTLEGVVFAATKRNSIIQTQEQRVQLLVTEHHKQLSLASGLEPIIRRLSEKPEDQPLSETDEGSPSALISALSMFTSFLSSPDTLSGPRLSLLPPKLRSRVSHQALEKICAEYSALCDAVESPTNKYEGNYLRTRKEQVYLLLGVTPSS